MDHNQLDPATASGIDAPARPAGMKYCKFCAALIPDDAIICTACGRQVEELRRSDPAPTQTVNVYSAPTPQTAQPHRPPKDKWIAFLLCLFLGVFGGHKFYEGRIGLGILYLFTAGLFGFGWLIDTLVLLFKPNPYYV